MYSERYFYLKQTSGREKMAAIHFSHLLIFFFFFFANLTQPVKEKENPISAMCPCANYIVHARFEDVRTFRYASVRVVLVFVRRESYE